MIQCLVFIAALIAEPSLHKKAIEEFNQAEEEMALGVDDPESGRPAREINLDEALKTQPVEVPQQTSKPDEKKKEAVTQEAGYLTKLSNAYGCFRDFLSAMLQQRFKRDTEFVACSTQGPQSCGESVQHENQKATTTLSDQFRVCINQPRD